MTGTEFLRADEVDLRDIARTVWKGKWIAVAITAIFVAAGAAYAFLATPMYRAESILMPADSSESSDLAGSLGGLASLASIAGVRGLNGLDTTTEAMAVIESRAFTNRFIEAHGLMPKLFADQWNAEKSQWKAADHPPTIRQAYDKWHDEILNVEEDSDTGLVFLTITWHDRQEAAEWCAAVVNELNTVMRDRAIGEARRNLEYLNNELNQATVADVRQAIYRLIEEQVKSMMLANTRREYAFKVIDPSSVPDENETVAPKRALILAISALCGLFLGLVAAFLRESFRTPPLAANAS